MWKNKTNLLIKQISRAFFCYFMYKKTASKPIELNFNNLRLVQLIFITCGELDGKPGYFPGILSVKKACLSDQGKSLGRLFVKDENPSCLPGPCPIPRKAFFLATCHDYYLKEVRKKMGVKVRKNMKNFKKNQLL